MKRFLIVLLLVISLSACDLSFMGTPQGESIEDCMEMDSCNYSDKNVETEGSELSNQLKELILNDEDEMYFHYKINPGDDVMFVEYITTQEFTIESLDNLTDLLKNANVIISNLYEIDCVNLTITYYEYLDAQVYFDEDNVLTEVLFNYNYKSYEDIKEDSESDIIEYIQDHADSLKTALDYDYTSAIFFYGDSQKYIRFIIEEEGIILQRSTLTNTALITEKLIELFGEYNIEGLE